MACGWNIFNPQYSTTMIRCLNAWLTMQGAAARGTCVMSQNFAPFSVESTSNQRRRMRVPTRSMRYSEASRV